jgi:benzoylformate decarboxylase
VIHIDLNAYEIAKNHRVDHGIVADPKLTLALLADSLETTMSEAQHNAARQRARQIAQLKKDKHAAALRADQAGAQGRSDFPSVQMAHFMQELAAQLPKEQVIIFDEALTNSPPVVRYWPPQRTGEYFLTRGGSLGVGIPGAIGAKLANPDKTTGRKVGSLNMLTR